VRRGRHLARTVIALLAVVAIWVVVVYAVVLVLNSAPVRTRVARKLGLMAQAAFGAPVGVGAVRIDLFPARLVLRDITVGAPDRPVLAIQVVEVGAGELRLRDREFVLRDLRIRGVRLHASAPAGTGLGGGEAWLRLVVEQLLVEDVRIERLELPSGLVFTARAVDARWSSRGQDRGLAGVVHVRGFAVDVPGLERVTGSLAGWGRLGSDSWEIGRLRGRGDGWEVDLRGGGRLVDGQWRVSGQVETDLAVLDRVVGIGAGLQGTARVSGEAGTTAVGPVVAGHVVTGPVAVVGFALDAVEGDVRVDAAGLEATVTQARVWDGTVSGRYALERFAAPWRHRVRASGSSLAVAALLAQLGVDPAGIAGSLDGEVELEWSGRQIGAGLGKAIAAVRPGAGDVPAAGTVVLTMEGDGTLRFASEGLTLAGAPVRWSGPLTLGSWVPSWRAEFAGLGVPVAARLLRGWVGEEVLPPELDGAVTGTVSLSGPFTGPRVEGALEARPLWYGPISFDTLAGSFRVEDGVLLVDRALGSAGTGRLEADGQLTFADGTVRLDVAAEQWPLERLARWAGLKQSVAGTVDAVGTLTGRLDSPRVSSRLVLADVGFAGVRFGAGTAQLEVGGGVVRLDALRVGPLAADVVVDVGGEHVTLGGSLAGFGLDGVAPALARLAGGPIDLAVNADFPFARPAGRLTVAGNGLSGSAELDGDRVIVAVERADRWRLGGEGRLGEAGFVGAAALSVPALRELLSDLTGAPSGLGGRLAGRADVTVAPGGAVRLAGWVDEAELEVGGERAALAAPAAFSYEDGAVEVAGAQLVGARSSLYLRGGRLADGALFGNFAGQLPLALLGLVWPDAAPRGQLEAIGELSGTDAAPRLEGTARIVGGVLSVPGFDAPITNLAGFVELAGAAVRIDGLRFSYGAGTGVCSGQVLLAGEPELDLSVEFENLRYPLSTDLAPRLTGAVRLTGPLSDLLLAGRATLLRTVYRRDVSLEKLVAEGFFAPQRTAAATGAIRLDLRVAVPGTLVIETTLARLIASGELRVVGNTNIPAVLGRLEAMPGAEGEVFGTRYEVDRAVVTFANPATIEPVIEVLARTEVQDVQITVALNGKLDRLAMTLNSSPPMPEMDILSMLFTGQRADEAAPLQTGAVASTFLTGQLASAATRRARTMLDLQEFRVDPYFATESGQPAARVTLTKQLSPKLTATVASNLESNREEVIKTRWRVAPGVYVVASRDADGTYSLDVKWLRRY
jgi:hypothetical protein